MSLKNKVAKRIAIREPPSYPIRDERKMSSISCYMNDAISFLDLLKQLIKENKKYIETNCPNITKEFILSNLQNLMITHDSYYGSSSVCLNFYFSQTEQQYQLEIAEYEKELLEYKKWFNKNEKAIEKQLQEEIDIVQEKKNNLKKKRDLLNSLKLSKEKRNF